MWALLKLHLTWILNFKLLGSNLRPLDKIFRQGKPYEIKRYLKINSYVGYMMFR